MTLETSTSCYSESAEIYPPSSSSACPEIQPAIANTLSENGVHEFYDPTGRLGGKSTEDFIDWVASSREVASLPGLGQLTPHEVILIEGMHCRVDDGDGIPLRIKPERQRAIVAATNASARLVSSAIAMEADEITAEYDDMKQFLLKKGKARMYPLPHKLVVSGMVLATIAHEDVDRRSGRRYFTHPEDVASEIRIGWGNIGLSTSHPHFNILQFLAFTHDGPEDTMDTRGKYIYKPVPITPLVAECILRDNDVEDPHFAAKSLFYLARFKDVEYKKKDDAKHRLPYRDYNNLSIWQPGLTGLFDTIIKGADNLHNYKIEPDKALFDLAKFNANLNKQEEYEQAKLAILQASIFHGDYVPDLMYSIITITKEQVDAESVKNYPIGPNRVPANVRRRLATRQG